MDIVKLAVFSSLPAILYVLIISLTTPYKSIKVHIALMYLFFGIGSILVLKTVWHVFPQWNHLAESLSTVSKYKDPFTYAHYLHFVQVAFLEEFSKLTVFLIVFFSRDYFFKPKADHPIAIMFYVAMASLGFAIIENITYGAHHGESVLKWRAVTAVIGHMVFGLFMGYWISLGRLNHRAYDRSLFDIIINRRPRVKMVVYTVIGLLVSVTLHGIYNLTIELNGTDIIPVMYFMLGVMLLGAYWCFKNLNTIHKSLK